MLEDRQTQAADDSFERSLGWRAALAIGACALLMRLGYLAWCVSRDVIHGLFLDSRFFALTAASIRAGDGAGEHPYLLSPLYPYFLALFGGVEAADPLGLTLVAPRVAQACLGAGTCVLAAAIARRIDGRASAWLAGLLCAFFGPLIHYDIGILVACPQAFFSTLSLYLLLRGHAAPARRATRFHLAAGVALGVAAALRPTALALGVACVGVWLYRAIASSRRGRGSGDLRAAAVFAAGIALAVAPFTLRNARVSGEPFLLSANAGMNFWVGNHAGANGVWNAPPRYDAYRDPLALRNVRDALGHDVSYAEASAWWRSRAMADMRAEPGRWLGLLGKKLLFFFHPQEIPQLGWGFDWARARAPILRLPLRSTSILLLALMAPLARRLASGRRGLGRLGWPYVFLLAYVAAISLFFVTGRYRIPIMPVGIVLASVAILRFYAAIAHDPVAHARRWRALAWLGGVLCVIVASRSVYTGAWRFAADTGLEELQRAIGLVHRGRHAQAAELFPALFERIDTDSGRAAYATALRALERSDQAVAQYRTIVERHPDNALAWYNLGNLIWEDFHRAREAQVAFERALRVEPDNAQARFNLGVMHLNQGRFDEAEREIRDALERAPAAGPWQAEARRALAIAENR